MNRILASLLVLLLFAAPARAILHGGTNITVTDDTISVSGPFTPTTLTAHGVLLGNGTGAIAASAAGTSGQPFLSGGAGGDGAYGAVSLSGVGVTGVLPVANGGTNSSASLSGSKCMRSSGGAIVEAAGDCATPVVPLLGFGSATLLTTSKTCYVSIGTTIDCTTEGNAQQRSQNGATFANLYCGNTAIQGVGNNVVITGRKGTCGSASDSSQVATITGSASANQSGADTTNTLVPTTGQCFDWKIVTPATLTASAVVNCTVERTA